MQNLAQSLGAIPGAPESLGKGDGVWSRHTEVGGEVVDAERGRSQSGHQGVARGRADGLITIGALEQQTARRKLIDVGRLHGGGSVAPQ